MHSELHVEFPLILFMEDEYHLVAPIGHKVLETQVAQGFDIGDGIFTKPHTIVIAIYYFLVGKCHCSALYLQSH